MRCSVWPHRVVGRVVKALDLRPNGPSPRESDPHTTHSFNFVFIFFFFFSSFFFKIFFFRFSLSPMLCHSGTRRLAVTSQRDGLAQFLECGTLGGALEMEDCFLAEVIPSRKKKACVV